MTRNRPAASGVGTSVLRRSLASIVLLLSGVVAGVGPSGGPAAASCVGPMLAPIAVAVRGSTMTVAGQAFGTDCYDTGLPPDAVGPLGPPIDEIDVVIVQDGNEVLVARGAADREYEFTVDVTVPPRLAPGPAELIARWDAAGGGQAVQPFEVAAAPPTSEPPGTTPVASFGPDETTTTTSDAAAAASPEAEDGPNLVVRVVPVLVLGGVVALVIWAVRRRRRPGAQPER